MASSPEADVIQRYYPAAEAAGAGKLLWIVNEQLPHSRGLLHNKFSAKKLNLFASYLIAYADSDRSKLPDNYHITSIALLESAQSCF